MKTILFATVALLISGGAAHAAGVPCGVVSCPSGSATANANASATGIGVGIGMGGDGGAGGSAVNVTTVDPHITVAPMIHTSTSQDQGQQQGQGQHQTASGGSATGGTASQTQSTSSSATTGASTSAANNTGNAQTVGGQQASLTVNEARQLRAPVNTAYAAPLAIGGGVCAYAPFSAGASGVGFSGSVTVGKIDEACNDRADADMLSRLGYMREAAEILKAHPHVAAAFNIVAASDKALMRSLPSVYLDNLSPAPIPQ